MTAHFLGGAVIARSPEHGVIDPYHRVWGYPGLHVRRRLGRLGQPRRQPVADHHGAGRAGHVVVAQPWRRRPAPGPGRALPCSSTPECRPSGRRRCRRSASPVRVEPLVSVGPAADRVGGCSGVAGESSPAVGVRLREWSFSAAGCGSGATGPGGSSRCPRTSATRSTRPSVDRRGWLRVGARRGAPSGETVWRTSLFPSAEAGAYVLPVKKAVRVAEGLPTTRWPR